MGKIIDVFKHIIEHGNTGPGFFIIIIAILVGVFKMYYLMAGVNVMSKEEKTKIDLNYLCNSFGILLGILGLFVLLSPFIFDYFNIKYEYRHHIVGIVSITYIVFMVLFLRVIKKDRIYKKTKQNDMKK